MHRYDMKLIGLLTPVSLVYSFALPVMQDAANAQPTAAALKAAAEPSQTKPKRAKKRKDETKSSPAATEATRLVRNNTS